MATYVAHYKSLDADTQRACGLFEFESGAKINSKQNAHDARLTMLENFGNEALSWRIEKIEKKKARDAKIDGQLAFDWRGPAPKKRKTRKKYL